MACDMRFVRRITQSMALCNPIQHLCSTQILLKFITALNYVESHPPIIPQSYRCRNLYDCHYLIKMGTPLEDRKGKELKDFNSIPVDERAGYLLC